MPASARTSPERVSRAATPPSRPASAVTAAAWMRLSIVERTALALGGARVLASVRAPAAQLPAGRALQLALEARARGRGGPPACRSRTRARTGRPVARASPLAHLPAIEPPTSPSGELRVPAGPSASTLPSTERIDARSAGLGAPVRRSPSSSPGNTRLGAPLHRLLVHRHATSPVTGPNTCVRP